eukprot:1160210-Pelagomonas_calceolata.AAC.8
MQDCIASGIVTVAVSAKQRFSSGPYALLLRSLHTSNLMVSSCVLRMLPYHLPWSHKNFTVVPVPLRGYAASTFDTEQQRGHHPLHVQSAV